MTTSVPTCWIIGGPNGAGKTTFALSFLPQFVGCTAFINADLIAGGISPLAPEAETITAGRIFREELGKAITKRESFAFETTLAGRGYLKLIERLKSEGWRVELLYLALPDLATSKSRVALRVAHGGHDIPEDALDRRFSRSLYNLFYEYSARVDRTQVYLNEDDEPLAVFRQEGDVREIFAQEIFDQLMSEAKR